MSTKPQPRTSWVVTIITGTGQKVPVLISWPYRQSCVNCLVCKSITVFKICHKNGEAPVLKFASLHKYLTPYMFYILYIFLSCWQCKLYYIFIWFIRVKLLTSLCQCWSGSSFPAQIVCSIQNSVLCITMV